MSLALNNTASTAASSWNTGLGDALSLAAAPRPETSQATVMPLDGYFPEAERNQTFEPIGGSARRPGQARPVLRSGDDGPTVSRLQTLLKAAGFDMGRVDGDFGPKTKAQLMAFQRAKGLSPDGVAGPQTWAALRGARSERPTSTPHAPAHDHGHTPASGARVQTSAGPMVRRGNELISVRIAPKWDAMVTSARKAGVNLRLKDGFRSHREQVVLWNRYGRDTSRVARPGHSNHQTGTAIDVENTAGAWAWMKRNAPKFGMFNYPKEAWHYSLTGT